MDDPMALLIMVILNLKFDHAEMKSALNYDPKNAQNFDNGVFWVGLLSILFFSNFCCNKMTF